MTDKKLESTLIVEKELQNPIQAIDFKAEDYIEGLHYQDCCENVYIDFEHVEKQRNEINSLGVIKKVQVMTAPEEGIILNLYNGEKDKFADTRVSIFLACRNSQNGYYSDSLDLKVNIEGWEHICNLNELGVVQDDIY